MTELNRQKQDESENILKSLDEKDALEKQLRTAQQHVVDQTKQYEEKINQMLATHTSELDKYKNLNEQLNILLKVQTSATEDHLSKFEHLEKLNKTLCIEKDEAKTFLEEFSKSLKEYENQSRERNSEIQQVQHLLSMEQSKSNQLQDALDSAQKCVAELQKKLIESQEEAASTDRSTRAACIFKADELESYKSSIATLSFEKQRLEDELCRCLNQMQQLDSNLRLEINQKDEELEAITCKCNELQVKLNKRIKIVNHKANIIAKLEALIHTETLTWSEKAALMQQEHNQMKHAESIYVKQITDLNNKLANADSQIKKHEDTIATNCRLLRIRGELINSIQQQNQGRYNDVCMEIDRTSMVYKMDTELLTKSEELQNLFSTLSTKQLEVTRQDKIIQMLEENNERNKRIRAKQLERISMLEHENEQLREKLSVNKVVERPQHDQVIETDVTLNQQLFQIERHRKRQAQMCRK